MCNALGLTYHTVSKENHKAILTERLHRYLNKVQRLHALDCAVIDDWVIGTTFGIYAWKSAPTDGTDIVRSYAAMGREFPFPIDNKLRSTDFSSNENHGELTVRHIDSAFPLLFRQRELLKLLVEDRRAHHRSLRNDNRQPAKKAMIFFCRGFSDYQETSPNEQDERTRKASVASQRTLQSVGSPIRQHILGTEDPVPC
jgi:hypothetical protein